MSEIEDPRVGNGKRPDLVEILVIAICGIFAEVEGCKDIADWARVKEPWLRPFPRLENDIPSHDNFNPVVRTLDPKHFEQVFSSAASASSDVAPRATRNLPNVSRH